MATYNWLWGYFIPIGFLMLVWAGLAPRQRRRLTPVATTAIALAILGYWAVGFALHMGGAYPVTGDSSLEALRAMLSLVPDNPGWGIIGLAGFFLSGSDITPEVRYLFLAYLPLIATAVVLVTVALAHTRRWIMVAAGILTGAVIVPIAACWVWGSGWLSHLGSTLGLGSGFVDFGGSTLILWLPGMIATPILLLQRRGQVDDETPAPPASYAPLVSSIGALLAGIGWLGWALSNPFHASSAAIDWQRTALNVLLGMAGAAMTAQLYGWLATGKLEALLASLGLGAGWGALLATAPFVPPWGALVIGLLVGLLFPLLHYLAYRRLHSHNGATVVALALTSGLLGNLGLAFLSDGRWGQGWNGLGQGLSSEAQVVGPGIAGVFVTGNAQQLSAQVIGLLALAVWGLLWGTAIGLAARTASQVSLPRRAASTVIGDSEAELGADADLVTPQDAEALDTAALEAARETTALRTNPQAVTSQASATRAIAPQDDETQETVPPRPKTEPPTDSHEGNNHIPYNDPLSTLFVPNAPERISKPQAAEDEES